MYLPEGYKPSKTVTIISAVVLAIGLAATLYLGYQRKKALSDGAGYTIGYTTGFLLTSSGRDVEYYYVIRGKTYTGSRTYAYSAQVPGGRYWVKFSIEHPEISELYQNKPVPDHITEAPPGGWKKRPW